MLVALLQVTLLLSTLVTLEAKTYDCEPGWFGKGCFLKCHCRTSQTCGDVNGECPNSEPCSFKYWGPGCQYVDWLLIHNETSNPQYLVDHDDKTCNTNKTAKSVKITLGEPALLTWLRIVVNNTKYLMDFVLQLNGLEACTTERRHAVNDTIVDVTCDMDFYLETLVIDGPITPYLCSVYISAGRNSALKQDVSQSSTSSDSPLLNEAKNAVDDDKDPTFREGHCSYTTEDNEPFWLLKYNNPQLLVRLVITNTEDHKERLNGVFIVMYDTTGKSLYTNKMLSNASVREYEVYLRLRDPVSSIKIWANDTRVLNLCEVETYGETVCPENTYGFSCENTCACKTRESCNQLSGICARGCTSGLYGYNCLNRCPRNCYQGFCLPRHGDCVGCNAGYLGTRCNISCDAGYYGPKCQSECSSICTEVCDFRSGQCKCAGKFDGQDCRDCKPGYYGTDCTKTCSEFCENRICDINSGECASCVGSRIGFTCEECPDTYYGPLCYSKCSEFCLYGLCNIATGSCEECTKGYTGPQCRFPPKEVVFWPYVLPPLIILIVGVVIICIFIRRKEKHIDYGEDK